MGMKTCSLMVNLHYARSVPEVVASGAEIGTR